jgi:basic membrane protein A
MIKRKGLKSVALAIAAFSLIAGACGSDSDTVTEETTAEATEESTAALPGEGILACQVTDTGGVDDKGFNQIAYKGLQDAEAQLGVSIDVLESTTDADYGPNLQNFADKGCNIIVTVGFLLGDATREAAEANPNIDYAIVDSAFDPPIANARGLLFATDHCVNIRWCENSSSNKIYGRFREGCELPQRAKRHQRKSSGLEPRYSRGHIHWKL